MQSTASIASAGAFVSGLTTCLTPIGATSSRDDELCALNPSFDGLAHSYAVAGAAANLVQTCDYAYSGSKLTVIMTEPSKFVSSLTSSRDLLRSSGYWSRNVSVDEALSPVDAGADECQDNSHEIVSLNFGRPNVYFPGHYLSGPMPSKSGTPDLSESPAASGREPNLSFSTLEDGLALIEVPEAYLLSDSDHSSHSATEPHDSHSSESDSYEEDSPPKREINTTSSKRHDDVSPELAKLLYWSHKLHSCRTTKDKPANSKKKASPKLEIIKPQMKEFKSSRSGRKRNAASHVSGYDQ